MSSLKDYVPVADSEPPLLPGSTVSGAVNPNEIAEVTLFLRKSPTSMSLDNFVEELGKVRVGERQYMSREALAANHSADPADIEEVARFAGENNLSVVSASPSRRTVTITGRLNDLSNAFHVKLITYRSPRGSFRSHQGPVNIPAALSAIVKGVFGLDNRPLSTPHLRAAPSVSGAQALGIPAGYSPSKVANLYNFPVGFNGQGQCIGIIEFGGGYRMNNINTYFQDLGLPAPNVTPVSVAGAFNAPVGLNATRQQIMNSADVEVNLDIEVAASIAQEAQFVVYFAPNTTLGWFRAITTAIHDSFNQPSVISISWGGPEESFGRQALRVLNFEFKVAAAMGISICVAAGDNGYTDGVPGSSAHVDFPASSPYVLACGGTSLQSSGNEISSETVWNDGPNKANPSSATGGGVSGFFPLPSYQSTANVPVSVNPPNNPGRGVPDVSGDADPNTAYRILVDGLPMVVGGTSAVAPLWAGLIALLNQKSNKSSGFLNPLLYNQGVNGGGFHDITIGNNGAYKAGPGWDPCTGLGSPDGTVLSEVL
jgi:kumamolisin